MYYSRNIAHNGRWRWYNLFVPNGYKQGTPIPVVFVFHGGGSNADGVRWESRFDEVAQKYGFAVVYPQGLPVSNRIIDRNRCYWNDGRRLTTGSPYKVDDVGFVKSIYTHIRSTITPKVGALYAGGYSNGGFFSIRLAQELPQLFTSVAALCGHRGPNDYQKATGPVNVMFINGLKDYFVPYFGGDIPSNTFVTEIRPLVDVYGEWVNLNQSRFISKTYVGDSVRIDHKNLVTGYRNRLITIEEHGHCWPSGNVEFDFLGPLSDTIFGAEEMWKFFGEIN